MPLVVAQISDCHLGPRTTLFQANTARIEAVLHASPPAALVASGDVSLDGAERDADLAFAAESLRRLAGSAPLLAIPGNHDIGGPPRTTPAQPVTSERLSRWAAAFGPDHWVQDLDGPAGEAWRLIGLNSEILGSGLPEEAIQAILLSEALASVGRRRIAVFLHRPIALDASEAAEEEAWAVLPEARPALAPLLEHPALRLVASGHVHLHRLTRRGEVTFAWAPPASFVCETELQPGIAGARLTGFLHHVLHVDHVVTELVTPPGLRTPFLEEVRAETYPR